MSDREEKIREELEKEAQAWVREESDRRFNLARETMEKQGKETEHHLKIMGVNDTSRIASETQMSISYARAELAREVQFEADKWVEEELKKRLSELK